MSPTACLWTAGFTGPWRDCRLGWAAGFAGSHRCQHCCRLRPLWTARWSPGAIPTAPPLTPALLPRFVPRSVVVFNLTKQGNVLQAILGDPEVGTSISSSCATHSQGERV